MLSVLCVFLFLAQTKPSRSGVVELLEQEKQCYLIYIRLDNVSMPTAPFECGNIALSDSSIVLGSRNRLSIFSWENSDRSRFNKLDSFPFYLNIRSIGAIAFSPLMQTNIYLIENETSTLVLVNLQQSPFLTRSLLRNSTLSSCNKLYINWKANQILYLLERADFVYVYQSTLIGSNFRPLDLLLSKHYGFDYTSGLLYFCKDRKIYNWNGTSVEVMFALPGTMECSNFIPVNSTLFMFPQRTQRVFMSSSGEVIESQTTQSDRIVSLEQTVDVLQDSTNPCTDLNCAQFCALDRKNMPVCLCANEFIDSMSCSEKHRNKLLFSSISYIFQFPLDVENALESEIHRARGGVIDFVVYDYKIDSLFYSLREEGAHGNAKIFRCPFADCTKEEQFGVAPNGAGIIEITAYDRIAGNLYFTDDKHNLGVIKLRPNVFSNESIGKFLHTTNAIQNNLVRAPPSEQKDFKLRGLAVDPVAGYLFIGDYGYADLIYRSDLDSERVSRLDLHQLFWPNGLAVDPKSETLYILDGEQLQLHQCDYSGLNQSVIYSVERQTNAIACGLVKYRSQFFISFRYSAKLEMFDMATGQSKIVADVSYTDAITSRSVPISSMTIVSESERDLFAQSENGCSRDNGMCSHFCFADPSFNSHSTADPDGRQRRCACPENMELMRSNTSRCLDEHNMFLYTTKKEAMFLSPTVWNNRHRVGCNFNDLELTGPAAYDYRLNSLFFVANHSVSGNYHSTSLFRCDLFDQNGRQHNRRHDLFNSKGEPHVIRSNVTSNWLAYDWSSRLIFWVDQDSRTIMLSTIDGEYSRVVASGVQRVCCLVFHESRLYFFSERNLMRVGVSSDWEHQIEPTQLLQLDFMAQPIHMSVYASGDKLFWISGSADNSQTFMSVYDISREEESFISWPPTLKFASNELRGSLSGVFINDSLLFLFLPKRLYVFEINPLTYVPQDEKFSIELEDSVAFLSVANIMKSAQPDTEQCFQSDSFDESSSCDQICFSDFAIRRDPDYRNGSCGCSQMNTYDEIERKCKPPSSQVQILAESVVFLVDPDLIRKPALPITRFPETFDGVRKFSVELFAFDVVESQFYFVTDQERDRKLFCSDQRTLKIEEIETSSSFLKGVEVDPISRLLVWYSNKKIFLYSLLSKKVVFEFSPVENDPKLKIEEVKILDGENLLIAVYEMSSKSEVAVIDIRGDLGRSQTFNARNNPRMLSVDQVNKVVSWTEGINEIVRLEFEQISKITSSKSLELKLSGKTSMLQRTNLLVVGDLYLFVRGDEVERWYLDRPKSILRPNGTQELSFKSLQDMKRVRPLNRNEMAKSKWCSIKNCSHFCDSAASSRCSCPVGFVLSSLSGSLCIATADVPTCLPEQRYLDCAELGTVDNSCPLLTFCSTYMNGTCGPKQQVCHVRDDVKHVDKMSSPKMKEDNLYRKVCYANGDTHCRSRPYWCECALVEAPEKSDKVTGGLKNLLQEPVLLAVFGCLTLIVFFGLVSAAAILVYKNRSGKKTKQSSPVSPEDRDHVHFSKMSNDVQFSANSVKFRANQNNLFFSTNINMHQMSSSGGQKSEKSSRKSNCTESLLNSSSSAHKSRSKKVQNNLQVPQNSIRSTSVFSSSCGTLNNHTGAAPPPTPNRSVIYDSELKFHTMCPDCRMRQAAQTPPASSPLQYGVPNHSKKSSWGAWRKERSHNAHNSQYHSNSHKYCTAGGGLQSGEESEPLFLPKPQGPGGLPSGSRFADFYPSHSQHHNSLPHNAGKYVKRRRFIMDELVTYTPSSSRGPPSNQQRSSSHHHHPHNYHHAPPQHSSHAMPPPPAPACTPLSGSQEFSHPPSCFLPPSPVSDSRASSMVYVVRQVHLDHAHDPPPSPVSNA